MVKFPRNLVIAALLAALGAVYGCSTLPAGQSFSVSLTADPIGLSVEWKNLPTTLPWSPAGWTMPIPDTPPAASSEPQLTPPVVLP
jgi:hypothetical protein